MKEPSHGPEPCASISAFTFIEISTVLTPNTTIFLNLAHTVIMRPLIFYIISYNR